MRRLVVALSSALALTVLAAPLAAQAQPTGKVARVGYLVIPPFGPAPAAFREACVTLDEVIQ